MALLGSSFWDKLKGRPKATIGGSKRDGPLRVRDIQDAPSLLRRLSSPAEQDKFSRTIREKLDPELRDELDRAVEKNKLPRRLLARLVGEMNRIIIGDRDGDGQSNSDDPELPRRNLRVLLKAFGREIQLTPYVGPRPFSESDQPLFFGRDQEASDFASRILSHSEVLLYAPSGAGKTSLMHAKLLPTLRQRQCDILPVARVHGPDTLQRVGNRTDVNPYVMQVIRAWHDGLDDTGRTIAPARLARLTLAQFLKDVEIKRDEDGVPQPRIVVFDQFEELFTSLPEFWNKRGEFFKQVAEALKEPTLRVVFVMREDFIAEMDPYAHLLPEKLRVRFRLDRLSQEQALDAVTAPLRNTHRRFHPGAAKLLLSELCKSTVRRADGTRSVVHEQYVESVQLQVVCQELWNSLDPDQDEITVQDVREKANVRGALQQFYERSIHAAVKQTETSEAVIREWFTSKLITSMGTRGTVIRGRHDTGGLPNEVVDVLESQYIIRAELRDGQRWYELAHDRLIHPVIESQRKWQEEGPAKVYQAIRRRARNWAQSGKREEGLLTGDHLLTAERALAMAKAEGLKPDADWVELVNLSVKARETALQADILRAKEAEKRALAEKAKAEADRAAADRARMLALEAEAEAKEERQMAESAAKDAQIAAEQERLIAERKNNRRLMRKNWLVFIGFVVSLAAFGAAGYQAARLNKKSKANQEFLEEAQRLVDRMATESLVNSDFRTSYEITANFEDYPHVALEQFGSGLLGGNSGSQSDADDSTTDDAIQAVTDAVNEMQDWAQRAWDYSWGWIFKDATAGRGVGRAENAFARLKEGRAVRRQVQLVRVGTLLQHMAERETGGAFEPTETKTRYDRAWKQAEAALKTFTHLKLNRDGKRDQAELDQITKEQIELMIDATVSDRQWLVIHRWKSEAIKKIHEDPEGADPSGPDVAAHETGDQQQITVWQWNSTNSEWTLLQLADFSIRSFPVDTSISTATTADFAVLAVQSDASNQSDSAHPQFVMARGSVAYLCTLEPGDGPLSAKLVVKQSLNHGANVECAAFRSDGKLLATGSSDRFARVWFAESGSPVVPPMPHADAVTAIEFIPGETDPAGLATSTGKQHHRWKLPPSRKVERIPLASLFEHEESQFAGDDLHDKFRSFLRAYEPVTAVDFRSADNRGWLAIADKQGSARIVTLSRAKKSSPWEPVGKPLNLRDDDLPARPNAAGKVDWRTHLAALRCIRFEEGRDGRPQWVATGSDDQTARVWDLNWDDLSGTPVTDPLLHQQAVTSVAFSPARAEGGDATKGDGGRKDDGAATKGGDAGTRLRFLATGCYDGTARVWDLTVKRVPTTPRGKEEAKKLAPPMRLALPVTRRLQHASPVVDCKFVESADQVKNEVARLRTRVKKGDEYEERDFPLVQADLRTLEDDVRARLAAPLGTAESDK